MKKALSLMLVLVLVLGMSTVAFAATVKLDPKTTAANRVTFTGGSHEDLDLEVQVDGGNEYKYLIDFSNAIVKGTPVASGAVTWNTYNGQGTMLEKQRKDSKVTIKTNIKKGSAAVDEVKFTGDDKNNVPQSLTLVLVDELKNTNTDDGVEFEVTSYLVVDGSHWNQDSEKVTWSGNLKNQLNEDVDADYDYFYMGTGIVVKPSEYVKNIELGIHEGDDDSVSVFAKLFKDKKYWAVADTDASEAQEEIMDKYGFETVYNLRNVNLQQVTEYVKLNNEDSSMFVYDGNLNLLGKGDGKLPWSEVYYLSATEIESDDEIEPTDDTSDDPEDAVPGGGDDYYPDNANDNPGTGC